MERPVARLALIVIPGVARRVTQRGHRRERVFFADDDDRARPAAIAEAERGERLKLRYSRIFACRYTPEA